MKKLTDNEIIKAMECCIDSSTVLACADCPLSDTKQCLGKPKTYVSNFIVEQALDLIKRQKAEIERLNEQIRKYDKEFEQMAKMVWDAKSEAIK